MVDYPEQQLGSDSSCLWQGQDAVDHGAVASAAALQPVTGEWPDLPASVAAVATTHAGSHSKLHSCCQQVLTQHALLSKLLLSGWVALVGLHAAEQVGHPRLGLADLPCLIWWSWHLTMTDVASTQVQVGRHPTAPVACHQDMSGLPQQHQKPAVAAVHSLLSVCWVAQAQTGAACWKRSDQGPATTHEAGSPFAKG